MKVLVRGLLAIGLIAGSAAPLLAAPCSAIPALPDSERRTEYTGISAQTGPFNVGFQLYGDGSDATAWLEVWVNGVKKSGGGVDYTVTSPSGTLGTLCLPITDAQVTFTVAQTGTIEIVGARRPRRTSQLVENRGVTAHDFNQLNSDLVAVERELWDLKNRMVLGLPSEMLQPLPSAANRAGKFLMFDPTGLIPQAASGAGSGNVVGPNSSTANHLAIWNNTTGTLLADGGIAGALANLNVGTGLASSGGNLIIPNSGVNYAKIQNESASTLLGNPTGGAAAPSEITPVGGLGFSGSNFLYATGRAEIRPSNGQTSGPWNVKDPFGNDLSSICTGTSTQCLQEFINTAAQNGWPSQAWCHGATLVLTSNGTTSNGSNIITGLSSTAALNTSTYLVGTNIPANTHVTSIDSSSQIHISNNATGNGTVSIKFTQNPTFIAATTGIQIPAVEQYSFDAYDCNLTFANTVNGPGLQFDSAMIVHFGWYGGQVVYQPTTPTGSSYAVYLNPTNPVPIDGRTTITASDIFISNIAAPAGSGSNAAVLGLNCSTGSIINNRFGSNELNGTGSGASPNTQYGIELFGATGSTSCAQNIFDIADIHLVSNTGIQEGTSTTNQTQYNGNIYRIGSIRPGSAAACASSFGTGSKFSGTCSNEESGGNVAQGLNFQSGSANITYDMTMIGVTTPLVNAGTHNNGVLNGAVQEAAGGSSTSIQPTGLITAQVTSHGTGADVTEDTLQTFNLPANAFDSVGRCVKIESWGTTGADANNKTVRLYFGAAIYNSTAVTTNNGSWYLWGRVCKTGSNTQTSVATGVFTNSIPITAVNNPNQTDTAAITIKVTGQNGTAVANDIVANGMTVSFEN